MKNNSSPYIVRCEKYDEDLINDAIHSIFHYFKFCPEDFKNKTVLLKPNLLEPVSPEMCVTTHPAIVKVVADILREWGAIIQIGDSPGESHSSDIKRLWKITEMNSAIADPSEIGVFEEHISSLKLDKQYVPIANLYYNSDFIINLPKVKTHTLSGFSCCVKNMFGLIPGKYKKLQHRRYPYTNDFCQFIADFAYKTRPHFTIVDGVWALEGDGPGVLGTPRQLGFLAGGNDIFMLDAFLLEILGYSLNNSPIHNYALPKYYPDWENDIKQWEQEITKYKMLDFQMPVVDIEAQKKDRQAMLDHSLYNLYVKRPVFDTNKCVLCLHCVSNCPTEALYLTNNTICCHTDRCIYCRCCSELCISGAVRMKSIKSNNGEPTI